MSIIIADERQELHAKIGSPEDDVFEVLYADDTLIVDQDGDLAEMYMYCIRDQGLYYGFDFNWTKIMYLSINCNPCIRKLDGQPVKRVNSMIYLCGLLADDGHIASELGRRIGLAHAEFSTLYRIWSHANITVAKKLAYFNTFIVSKLMYAVDGMWLSNTGLKRLDAFHCTCVRRILKIQHSSVGSRMILFSNVLRQNH